MEFEWSFVVPVQSATERNLPPEKHPELSGRKLARDPTGKNVLFAGDGRKEVHKDLEVATAWEHKRAPCY